MSHGGDLPTFGADVVGFHFGSYSMVAGETARTLLGLASRERGRFISYDANVRLNVEPDRAFGSLASPRC